MNFSLIAVCFLCFIFQALLKQCQAKIENTVEQHRRRHNNFFGLYASQEQRRPAQAVVEAPTQTITETPALGGNDKTDNAPNGV